MRWTTFNNFGSFVSSRNQETISQNAFFSKATWRAFHPLLAPTGAGHWKQINWFLSRSWEDLPFFPLEMIFAWNTCADRTHSDFHSKEAKIWVLWGCVFLWSEKREVDSQADIKAFKRASQVQWSFSTINIPVVERNNASPLHESIIAPECRGGSQNLVKSFEFLW